MKKRQSLVLTIAAVLPIATYGATTCIPSGIYFAVLNPDANGTVYSTSGYDWVVNFDYTTGGRYNNTTTHVTGIASCSEVAGTTDSSTGAPGMSAATTGPNCWCEMTAPLASDWVFSGTTYTGDTADNDCTSGCATVCANRLATTTTFRTTIYGTVW